MIYNHRKNLKHRRVVHVHNILSVVNSNYQSFNNYYNKKNTQTLSFLAHSNTC